MLQALRTALRQLHLLDPNWAVTLIDTLETAMDTAGSTRTLDLIISEVLQTSIVESENLAGGPLTHLATFLLILRLSPGQYTPLIALFVEAVFPSLFDSMMVAFPEILQPRTAPYVAAVIARLTKRSLLTVADVYPAQASQCFADDLAEKFMAVLEKQLRRPVVQFEPKRTQKTGKIGKTGKPLTAVQRSVLEEVHGLLVGDEDIRSRWPGWGEDKDILYA